MKPSDNHNKKGILCGFLFFIFLALPTPANAYLDPGTGSLILQSILGGLAAAATILSLYYRKIKEALKRMFGASNSEDTKQDNDR